MLREQELIVQIYIDDNPIKHFLSFELRQEFNTHHSFELRMEHGMLGLPGLIDLRDTRAYIGRKFIISFGYDVVNLQNFSGLITHVLLSQSNGFQGEVVIKGYSPTILLERNPNLGSYLDYSLTMIVDEITKPLKHHHYHVAINPSRKGAVDYLIQYKESDFNFLNRLSATYFEWFYYDGEQLHFGKPNELYEGKLTYGQEIKKLEYGVNIASIKQNQFYYESKDNQMMNTMPLDEVNSLPDLEFAIERANEIYYPMDSKVANVRVENSSELKTIVEKEAKANAGQLLKVQAESDSPMVRLGSAIQIDTSVRRDLNFVKDTLGTFLITSVHHKLDGLGRYSNQFEGIDASIESIAVRNVKTPTADLTLADVVDNADPLGQGRVKVRFKWQCQHNDETECLRVLTPHAGSSEVLPTNRGLVFIPEVGDQVIIGFEEGNVANPVVVGSVYHGESGTGGQVENHIKSIQTRSGNKIIFNDAEGSIYIEDPSGNTYFMDGNKNITVTAPDNINIQAGKDINISAGQNLNINVGNDMTTQVSQNNTVQINQKHQFRSDSYKQNVQNDKQVTVGGKLDETTSSSSHKAKNGDILIQSAGIAKILGKIDAKVNKG